MLKAAVKRPFDSDVHMGQAPSQCSPHRIQFLESPNKRTCHRSLEEQQRMAQAYQANSNCNPRSVFQAPAYSADEAADVIARCKRVRRTQPQNLNVCNSENEERIFTIEEVKQIVKKAVEERDQFMRHQYDTTLQQRLQEQYESFSKFNQDYVSRQLRQSDFSYMS